MIKLCYYDVKECIKWLKFVHLNYVFVLWSYRFKLRFVTVFEKQCCLLTKLGEDYDNFACDSFGAGIEDKMIWCHSIDMIDFRCLRNKVLVLMWTSWSLILVVEVFKYCPRQGY